MRDVRLMSKSQSPSKNDNSGTASRGASITRTTGETSVSVSVNLDNADGVINADTSLKFLDHMLVSFAKHAMIDLTVKSKSLDGIHHHLVEDTAIAVGCAIDQALGPRRGITRFGHASVPLDESLAEAVVDLVRRPYVRLSLLLDHTGNSGQMIEDVAKEDVTHFFQSLLDNMAACIHLDVRYGENDHHKAEAAVKSVAVALRTALAIDTKRAGSVPSTKGSM